MSPRPGDPGPARRPAMPGEGPTRPRGPRPEESLLRGGLTGIALVTSATVGLAAAAGLIALVVSLLYG